MPNQKLTEARILIVDDQEANIDVLQGFLEMQGYQNILTTQDPREVVHLFASFEPDLILLDLSMPYLSGFEVMEQLRSIISEDNYLPILVLTADVTSQAKQRALSGGASDFLTKPFDLIEVGLRIKNLLVTSFLQQELKNQNQILEERVKERTFELEQRNKELIVAKEKAEASDRLKTSFINNISHEIRTPLNGILGFGQILADSELSEEEKNEYLEMMNESSSRLINIITNFMDISLLNSGNQKVFKKEININRLLNEVSGNFADVCASKNLKINLEPERTSYNPVITSDRELLHKIFVNLIDNAVKFTLAGTITIGYKLEEQHILFFIKDTGIGISEEDQKVIFDIFHQVDFSNTRGYEGSGLGLAIAKGLVILLEGKIWVESQKGQGSSFFFSIPLKENNQKDLIKPANDQPHATTRQTILIAEDDDINFHFLSVILKDPLIKIIHAKNGNEAIEICQNHPEIKLVLMDLKMPETDGFEATRQIKTQNKDLPVIAITAYSGNEEKQKALLAGCDDIITKPVKRDFLIKKMVECGIFIIS